MSTKNPLASAARNAGSPLRNFFNGHFEMVKDEVRRSTAPLARSDEVVRSGDNAELANAVAETQLHQARVIGELRREIGELRAEVAGQQRAIEELTAAVRDCTAVLAVSTVTPVDLDASA